MTAVAFEESTGDPKPPNWAAARVAVALVATPLVYALFQVAVLISDSTATAKLAQTGLLLSALAVALVNIFGAAERALPPEDGEEG